MSDRPRADTVLAVADLRKAFGATQALAGAALTLTAGEVHVLLGENGSGKSTLAKILAGIHSADSGDIAIGGVRVRIVDARHARELGIAIVFQELSLAPDLSVADNLFLGREQASFPFAFIDRARERRACVEALARLDLAIDLARPARALAIAEKQLVEVAKALLQKPHILILDEPTATLSEREKSHLFAVVRRLRDEGVAILYITHHLREVAEIGDRVSGMRDGVVVTTRDVTPALTEHQLLELLTGRQVSAAVARSRPPAAAALLEVRDLAVGHCRGASLRVGPGEIVGLYGVVGCGREDLARAAVGVVRPSRGHLLWRGRDFRPRSPAAARRAGIGYLPADRKDTGILAARPVRENLNLANLAAFAWAGVIAPARERAPTLVRLAELGVRFRSAEDPILALSGGNQQKVLFGRAVGPAPALIVLEDPTAGIDMGAKLELYRHIRRWAEDGLGFLWLSSDLVETLSLCHRVYAMYAGRTVAEFVAPSLADESALLAAVLGREDGPRSAA
jgi:ribose transport system ATP-binding protein